MNRLIFVIAAIFLYITLPVSLRVAPSLQTKIFAQEPSKEASPAEQAKQVVPDTIPQTGINLTLSPTFLSLITDPGQEVSSQIRIRNNSNVTEYLRFSLAKFELADGGIRPLLSPVKSDDEFAKWVSFSEDEFSVAANETKTIRITIRPPKSASLGYYYGVLVNRMVDAEQTTTGAAVSGAPAILTLLEVRTPYAKRELQLTELTTDKLMYEYLPTEFRVKVQNTGNIHIAPAGDIFIDQGSNKDIAIFRINEARGNVLPDSSRTFTASWADGFIVRVPKEENGKVVRNEKSDVVYKTNWDLAKADKFRIGKYTAHALMIYNNGERDIPLEATVSFWVVPWKILLIAGAVVVLVLFGLKSIISNAFRGSRRRR